MTPINPLYSGFDPLWEGHKKDLPTLLKYLNITGKIFYLAIVANSFYVHFVLSQSKINGVQLVFLMAAFFIPIAIVFYLFSVYRVLWRIAPNTGIGMKIWKWLFGFWMIIFLLVNLFQIVTSGVGGNEYLFTWSGTPISYSLFTLVVNIGLAIVGELMMLKITRAIKVYHKKINL
jgi:hypothetical protein